MTGRKGYFTNGVFTARPAPVLVDEAWWELDLLIEQGVPCRHEPSHNERTAGQRVA